MPGKVIYIDEDGSKLELDNFLLVGIRESSEGFEFFGHTNVALPDYATVALILKTREMLDGYETRFTTELFEQYKRRYGSKN